MPRGALPALFRPVHQAVYLGHDLVDRSEVAAQGDRADANGDVSADAAQTLAELPAHVIQHDPRLDFARPDEKDGKLVAAETGKEVGAPDTVLDRRRDHSED